MVCLIAEIPLREKQVPVRIDITLIYLCGLRGFQYDRQ
jgi:hypothetical protein